MAFSLIVIVVIVVAVFILAGVTRDRNAEAHGRATPKQKMKRIILIHGWGGNPDEAWMPDFKARMREAGYTVLAPDMPDRDAPRIETWIPKINDIAGTPYSDTHFIGHSIGCQAILRYIAGLPESIRVGHVVLVAPWMNLTDKPRDEEERAVAKPWLTTPIDTDAVRRVTKDITCIMSDDDPEVPLTDADVFRNKLGARIILEHSKGHFSEDSGIRELPSARGPFGVY